MKVLKLKKGKGVSMAKGNAFARKVKSKNKAFIRKLK